MIKEIGMINELAKEYTKIRQRQRKLPEVKILDIH